ncbi:MAG: O-antigen ligase family protein [Candidatus Eisenbacteria bacterium]|nr:O-antigen ligase family protein [Candidatus Eisenbacteria bacterium]
MTPRRPGRSVLRGPAAPSGRRPARPLVARPPGAPPSEVPHYNYGWLIYVGGALLTVLLAVAIHRLHYDYGQAPHRILKILAGLGVFLVVLLRPPVALHAWLLAIPLGEWLPATGIPGVNGPNLLFLALVASWVLPRAFKRERIGSPARIAWPLTAYIAVLVLSLVRAWVAPPGGGTYPGDVMLRSVWQSAVGLAVYFVVANTVANKEQARNLLVSFGVGVSIAGLIALREFLRRGPDARVAGAIGDINDLGAYFALCVSVLAGLAFASGAFRGWKRLVVWAAAALAFIGVAFPKSRGGFVGAAAGLGLGTYLTNRRAIVIFVIVLAASPLWAPGFVKDRVAETTVTESLESAAWEDQYAGIDPNVAVRFEIWKVALAATLRSPIIGYGYASVPYLTGRVLDRPYSAHSLYVETAAQSGIVGLVVLFWLIKACVGSGRELLSLSPRGAPRGLAVGFLSGTVALLLACVFGQRLTHVTIAGTYFFLAGLVDRSIALERAEALPAGAETEHAS